MDIQKEANWIRLKEIAQIAAPIIHGKIIDKEIIRQLDTEVSAMLRHLGSAKRFFRRLG